MNNIDSSTSPLVSIVTVVRNAAKEIAKTFSSIRSIKNEYVEYIVIDGNSTDGTQEVAAQYADTIDVFLSESDKGIYDAMNKASKLTKGHYILNINAGDTLLYLPYDILQNGVTSQVDVLCGCVKTEKGIVTPSWSKQMKYHNTLPHQGCFYSRQLLLTHPYNLNYRIFADFDVNQRLFQHKVKTLIISDIIAFHSINGISNDSHHATELFQVIRNNFGLTAVVRAWCHFKFQGLRQRIKYGFGHSRCCL